MQQHAEHLEPPKWQGSYGAPSVPWKGLLTAGVVLVILGLLAIVAPLVATITLTVFFGVILAAAGLAQLVYAFTERGERHFLGTLFLGLLAIAAGLALLSSPLVGAVSLTLVLGMLFMADGVVRLFVAFQRPALYGRGWFIVNGVLTFLLGLIILSQWPQSAGYVLGVLVGIGLFFSGLTNIMFAFAIKRMSRRFQ